MKVAAIQLNATSDVAHNRAQLISLIAQAACCDAKLIVTPEVCTFRGHPSKRLDAIEPLQGPTVQACSEIARTHKCHIVIGSLYEMAENQQESRPKCFNTSVVLNSEGAIEASYRKMHLFDVVVGETKITESSLYLAGNRPVRTSVGNWQLGLSICYDIRFPELYRAMYPLDIITAPASFTKKTGEQHWEVLLRSRAIENLCWLIAPNQFGIDGAGVMTYGNSMIVNAWGDVVARASADKTEIIYAQLDKAELDKLRTYFPALSHRRVF